MKQFIKNFVEANIVAIEDKRWTQVFFNWYHTQFESREEEAQMFREFYNILQHTGCIDNVDATDSCRRRIIRNESDRIVARITSSSGACGICLPLETIRGQLNNYVGLTKEEVDDIIYEYFSDTYEFDSTRKGFLL